MASANVVHLSDGSFEDEVLKSETPVVVDFWAEWCGPCRMLSTIVDELARELDGQVKVAKLDVDSNPVTTARFNVRSIPTLLLFRDGQLVESIVGLRSKHELAARIAKLAA